MPDMAAIAGLVTSIKAVSDIAGSILATRDQALIQSKISELNQAVLASQSAAIDAQMVLIGLIARNSELESLVKGFEDWRAIEKQYELREVGEGVSVYYPVAPFSDRNPQHILCPACFMNRRKALLQPTQRLEKRRRVFQCSQCNAEIAMIHPFRATAQDVLDAASRMVEDGET